jgi:hypothetical protein
MLREGLLNGCHMKKFRWFLLLFILEGFYIGHSKMLSAAEQQPSLCSDQEGVHFDREPLISFIRFMMQRLRIDAAIVRDVSLKMPISIHKDAPISDQELFALFITSLHDFKAELVKRGSIYQILSLSNNSHEGWEPVVALSPAVRTAASGGVLKINADEMDLSDILPWFIDPLNLTPIVINRFVDGHVTIVCSTPIQREKALELLITLLKDNNSMLLESNGNYEIIPVSNGVPEGWTRIHQPFPLKPGLSKQRRSLSQNEWESHILDRIDPRLPRPIGQFKLPARVEVELAVNESGKMDYIFFLDPNNTKPESSLAEAAINALRQWRFLPFIGANGNPECVSGVIAVIFSNTGVEYDYAQPRPKL